VYPCRAVPSGAGTLQPGEGTPAPPAPLPAPLTVLGGATLVLGVCHRSPTGGKVSWCRAVLVWCYWALEWCRHPHPKGGGGTAGLAPRVPWGVLWRAALHRFVRVAAGASEGGRLQAVPGSGPSGRSALSLCSLPANTRPRTARRPRPGTLRLFSSSDTAVCSYATVQSP
jgi:hypothetical protein